MSKEESLRQLLKPIAERNDYKNFEINIEEISSGGANYTSKLYPVVIKENGKKDLNLFCKVAGLEGKSREVVEQWDIYSREVFFYNELAKTYQTIEEECGILEENKLSFSQCYGWDSSLYKETIVLEDLAAKGWCSYDRFKSVDWAYASGAIKELAKLHALSFAYANKYPVKHQEVLNRMHFDYEAESFSNMLKSSAESALREVRQENKAALEKYWQEYGSRFSKFNQPIKHTVLIHGDYRPSNLMHRNREDGTVDIKIVDLQTIQASTPIVDLLYFIFTGSDEEFRAKYFDRLIDHYYTQLHAAMKRLDLDPEKIFSRADFDYELKEKLPFGLTVAIFALPVVTVEEEHAPKVNEDLDMTNFSIEKTSDLYAERINGVVNDYVKWGILK